jgi:hypothetical protein
MEGSGRAGKERLREANSGCCCYSKRKKDGRLGGPDTNDGRWKSDGAEALGEISWQAAMPNRVSGSGCSLRTVAVPPYRMQSVPRSIIYENRKCAVAVAAGNRAG